MKERKRVRGRFGGIVLLLALAAVAPRAGAVAMPGAGPGQDGWIRAVRYASCAVGAFTSVTRMDGAVLSQSLLFCAQLLSEESQ